MIITPRRMMVVGAVGMVGAAIFSSVAHAQSPDIHSGDQVRFTLVGGTIEQAGKVGAVKADSLILRLCENCQERRYAFSEFATLSVYRHVKTPRARNAVNGSLIGLLAGGIIGVAIGVKSDRNCHDGPCGLGGPLVGAAGAVAGAVIGGVVGAIQTRGEWKQVIGTRDSIARGIEGGTARR